MAEWTDQQQRIFEDVAEGPDHTIILARAGCGKTSTLVEAVKRIWSDRSILFLAFNKAIAAELDLKIGHRADVHTCHSFGLRVLQRALPRASIDTKKVWKATKNSPFDRHQLCKAVGLAKAAQLSEFPPNLARQHGLDLTPQFAKAAFNLLESSYQTCQQSFDYDDMIWLPNEIADCKVPQFDLVLVDELQDLSPAQVELALKAVKPGGRIVAAGDNFQACYQFRGAGSDSVFSTQKKLGAKVLPLTTTFRCSKKIVAEANRWVKDIKAAEGAGEGLVRRADEEDLLAQVEPGDFILARKNAPLLSVAWQLVAAGIPCQVAGRDFGKGLIKLLEAQKVATIGELVSRLTSWAQREAGKAEVLDGVHDKLSCALALCRGAKDPEEVTQKAKEIFADRSNESVVKLSSTHRAKGLEADRVWLLWDSYLSSKRLGAKMEQEQVERNLAYIGVTRARKELVYVTG